MRPASLTHGKRVTPVIRGVICLLATLAVTAGRGMAETRDNTLVWGVHTRPTIINPVLTSSSISVALVQVIFNSLVRVNSQGMIEPDLAYRWEISPDGKVYTFHLRRGVYFHDGKELTSEDVKFTYEKIIDPSVHSPAAPFFACVERFESPDAWTFRIYLKERRLFFLERLVKHIVPWHLLKDEDMRKTEFNSHPVGTGPFRFREWTDDGTVVLEANAEYYEGRPRLDRIIVRAYDDIAQTWSALLRSEIDLAMFISPTDAAMIENDPAFRVHTYPDDVYCALFFNPDDPLLQDKNIRKAISFGINRQELIASVMDGHGQECYGPFSSVITDTVSGEYVTYDPRKAQQLLAAAGWKDDGSGTIRDKDGKGMELRILVDSRIDIMKKAVMVIRQRLQDLGIKVYMVPFNESAALTKEFMAAHRPQAVLRSFITGDDFAPLEREWSSVVRRKNGDLWAYHNNELNRLIDQGKREGGNRRSICRKIQEIMRDDCPAGFLFYFCSFHAVSADFANTDGFFTKAMPVYLLKNWEKRERR